MSDIAETVTKIPVLVVSGIVDGIRSLIIPDEETIQGYIDELTNIFSSIGVTAYDMSSLFSNEKPLEDITCDYMGQKVVIVDMSVVDYAVGQFRGVIRGFMYLMLVFYNFNQFMGLIGQQSMTLGGIISTVTHSGGVDYSKTPEAQAIRQFHEWTR